MVDTTQDSYDAAATRGGGSANALLTAQAFLDNLTSLEKWRFFPHKSDNFPRTVGRFVSDGRGNFSFTEDFRPTAEDICYVATAYPKDYVSKLAIRSEEYTRGWAELQLEYERGCSFLQKMAEELNKTPFFYHPCYIIEKDKVNRRFIEGTEKLERIDRTLYDFEVRFIRISYIKELLERSPGLTPDSWRKANGLISGAEAEHTHAEAGL